MLLEVDHGLRTTHSETKHALLVAPPPPDPSQVEDSTHTHLPNIETSSQLLEPDQSLTNRQEIDVTYAKLSKAQRKRRPAVASSGPATHSSIPVKCKRVELEEVFPMVWLMQSACGGEQCSVLISSFCEGWCERGMTLL